MRIRSLSVIGVVAVWLLADFWRLWTPSLITLFGRAAETPAEIMGAYALAVMAVPLLLLAFVRRAAPALSAWLLVAAFAVRIVLRMNPDGGDVQLYGASLGVALVVAALCLSTGFLGRTLVPSILLGLALSTTTHAMLGSFGAVWRRDLADVVLLLVQALLVWLAVRSIPDSERTPSSPRTALLLLPSLLILQLALSNVGRGSALEPVWGPIAVIAGLWAAVVVSLLPAPRRRPWMAAAVAVGAVLLTVLLEVNRGGAEGVLSAWAVVGILAGPAAYARLLLFAGAGRSPRRAGLAAGAGAVVWTVVLFVFYAGYDLGYRADAAIVALAVVIAGWTLAYRPGTDAGSVRTERRIDESGARAVAGAAVAGAFAMLAALLGPAASIATTPVAEAEGDDLVVAAYNLRMGYGIDGVFDPAAVADQVRASGARVVLLSEVDRGWLLNGGQDELAILARMLDMHLVFGPAADQVWGDAILTDLEVSDAGSTRYPRFDALTGSGMTEATVQWRGAGIRVVSTHLQPDGNELDATDRAAAIFADALSTAAADGPVIGGGDLNTTPGSAAWGAIESSGAEDALAGIRPALTSPADAPAEQIDHLFTSGVRVVSAEVVPSELSDHLMIVVRVRLG